jgi:hypothetical protein
MNQPLYAFLAASSLAAALAIGACGGDSLPSDTQSTASSSGDTSTTTTGPGSTSGGGMSGTGGTGGTGGAGGAGGGAPDCFTNPMTHVEIINACTTADKVDKTPNLPLLGPNGELPPLP